MLGGNREAERGRERGGDPPSVCVLGAVRRGLVVEAVRPATLMCPLRPTRKYVLMVLSFISTSGAGSKSYLPIKIKNKVKK